MEDPVKAEQQYDVICFTSALLPQNIESPGETTN